MSRLLSATGLVVMWSSGFVGARLGTDQAPADTLLAWRYLTASAVLVLVVAVVRRHRRPRPAGEHGQCGRAGGAVVPGSPVRRERGPSAAPGPPVADRRVGELGRQAVLGLLCQCLYLAGIVTGVGLGVPAGVAALVAVLQPLVVGALAGPVLGEPVRPRQWAGLLVGVVSVAGVVGGQLGGGGRPLGYVLVVGGMLSLSVGTLLERRWRLPTPVLDSLTLHCLVSTAVFVASAALAGRLVPPAAAGFWWAVVWVVVLSTFGGYGCYLLSLRAFGATGVSTLLNLTPPTTMLWALLMFDEHVGWLGLAGLLGCACSVWLVLANGRGTWSSIRSTRPGSSTTPGVGESPSSRSPTPTPRSVRPRATWSSRSS